VGIAINRAFAAVDIVGEKFLVKGGLVLGDELGFDYVS
jgi:hypothetical protein